MLLKNKIKNKVKSRYIYIIQTQHPIKKFLMLTKSCIYLLKDTVKQYYCEVLLQLKINVFYFIIYEHAIYCS